MSGIRSQTDQKGSEAPPDGIRPRSTSAPNSTEGGGLAAWFTSEIHAHEGHLKSYLRLTFPSIRDFDDVVQESYLRIWKARAAQEIRSAKAFLFKVARNIALDSVRRNKISPVAAVPDLAAVPVMEEGKGVVEAACTREEIALLAAALDALPPRCREVIMLRKFQNLPQKKVARLLGISEGTVQEQVYRGLRRVEKILIERGVIRAWTP